MHCQMERISLQLGDLHGLLCDKISFGLGWGWTVQGPPPQD